METALSPSTRKEREVWQACDSLQSDNFEIEQITGLAIGNRLEELGFKRGSNSDIHRYKKSWLKNKGYEPVLNDNHKSMAYINIGAKEELNSLQSNYAELREEYDNLLQTTTNTLQQTDLIQQERQHFREQLATRIDKCIESNETTLLFVQELIEKSEADYKLTISQLRSKLDEQKQRFTSEITAMREQYQEIDKQLNVAQKEIEFISVEKADLEERAQEAHAERDQFNENYSALQEENSQKAIMLAEVEGQLKQQQLFLEKREDELKETRGIIDKQQKQIMQLKELLGQANNQIEDLHFFSKQPVVDLAEE